MLAIPVVAPSSVVSLSYRTAGGNGASQATYTFTGVDIGAAAVDRIVVVGFTGPSAAARSTSSVTIAGVSATPLIQQGEGTTIPVALYAALIPTGTTATISITYSAAAARCGYGVWAVYGSGGTIVPNSTTSAAVGGATVSASLDCAGKGCAIAFGLVTATSASGETWTNLSADFGSTLIVSTQWITGASSLFSGSSPGLSITLAGAGTGVATVRFIAVSFGPV